jgi:hypothetical protein
LLSPFIAADTLFCRSAPPSERSLPRHAPAIFTRDAAPAPEDAIAHVKDALILSSTPPAASHSFSFTRLLLIISERHHAHDAQRRKDARYADARQRDGDIAPRQPPRAVVTAASDDMPTDTPPRSLIELPAAQH